MKNNKTEYFPISTLREELRLRASEYAGRLSRSVGRLTSCDRLPCLEYAEEVARLSGLPIVMTSVRQDLYPAVEGKVPNAFPLGLQKNKYL